MKFSTRSLKAIEIGLGALLVVIIVGALFDVTFRIFGPPFFVQLILLASAAQFVLSARRRAIDPASGGRERSRT